MRPEEDSHSKPLSAPDGTWPRDQWPVDVIRTDASGEVDLSHIEYNLSLTHDQRVQQLQQWIDFIEIVRAEGRRWRASDRRTAETCG